MKSTSLRSTFLAAAVCSLAGVLPASAATISEASFAGGDFGNSWSSPTMIANGFDLVTGTGSGNDYDIFALTGLATGAQQITLSFSAPQGVGNSYAAGGNVLYSTSPFRWGWDGTTLGSVGLSFGQQASQMVLNLDDTFGGELYLGLYFTYGTSINYAVSLPGNVAAPPPAVPLPAAGLLMGAALAGFGTLKLRRKTKRDSA